MAVVETKSVSLPLLAGGANCGSLTSRTLFRGGRLADLVRGWNYGENCDQGGRWTGEVIGGGCAIGEVSDLGLEGVEITEEFRGAPAKPLPAQRALKHVECGELDSAHASRPAKPLPAQRALKQGKAEHLRLIEDGLPAKPLPAQRALKPPVVVAVDAGLPVAARKAAACSKGIETPTGPSNDDHRCYCDPQSRCLLKGH